MRRKETWLPSGAVAPTTKLAIWATLAPSRPSYHSSAVAEGVPGRTFSRSGCLYLSGSSLWPPAGRRTAPLATRWVKMRVADGQPLHQPPASLLQHGSPRHEYAWWVQVAGRAAAGRQTRPPPLQRPPAHPPPVPLSTYWAGAGGGWCSRWGSACKTCTRFCRRSCTRAARWAWLGAAGSRRGVGR